MNNAEHDERMIKKLAIAMAEHTDATLKEIAEAAEISKATLHRLYGTRENLEKLLTDRANAALDKFVKVTAEEFTDYHEAIRRLISISNDGNELLGYIFSRQSNLDSDFWKGYYKAIDNFFLNGQKSGAFSINLPVPFLTEMFISTACNIPEAQRRGRIALSGVEELFMEFFMCGTKKQ